MTQPHVAQRKTGGWDILYLGKCYPFDYEKKADAKLAMRYLAEDLAGTGRTCFLSEPINWSDYSALEVIG